MKAYVFGYTALGLPITAYTFGSGTRRVLILGGVHGDEPEGVIASYGLLDHFQKSFPYNMQLTLVPAFNLDGVLSLQRSNSHGVDLNRNMPTVDWSPEVKTERYHPGPSAASEPETKALIQYLEKDNPQFIISLHSWKPLLNINGSCRQEAEAIAKFTDYTIEESIGYPTPGCLGTYGGLEREMPTLTYEIERGLNPETILKLHVPAILEGLKVQEARAHDL